MHFVSHGSASNFGNLAGMADGGRSFGARQATFDDRVAEASSREQHGGWSARFDRSPSSSRRSWHADQRQGSPMLGKQWICKGQLSCGYRNNPVEAPLCKACSRPWHGYTAEPVQRKGAALQLANSYHPLAATGLQEPLSPGLLVPPWKQMGKGRGGQSWPPLLPVRNPGKGKGRSAPPSRGSATSALEMEVDIEGEVAAGSTKMVDLEALKRLHASTVSTLGVDSLEAVGLQERILLETNKKRDSTPKHILLNNLEKKLKMLDSKVQKNEERLGLAEENLVRASNQLEEIKATGRGLHQQQQALEEERAQIGLCLQSGEALETKQVDPWVAKWSNMLALASTHVDAGDERAKELGHLFHEAAASLEQHLQAYDTKAREAGEGKGGSKPPAAGDTSGASVGGAGVTQDGIGKARSRSPNQRVVAPGAGTVTPTRQGP